MAGATTNARGSSGVAEMADAASHDSMETLESLQTEIRELRRNNQYRSLFLSRLAHELRTPLTSILGFSEILLSQEKLTAPQRSFCERIQSSAQQLQASLNQMSDLARLETGQTQLTLEKFAIAETILDVLPALTRPAEKKRLELKFDASDDLPPMVSDPARVRQVLYNVLAYAIYRSPEKGTVTIDVGVAPAGLAIVVRDEGDRIQDTSRVGIIGPDDNSGTGELGMSIARQGLELLGGTVSAHNIDRGVEIRIHFPLGGGA
jgi:signal transduction histidine kinase